MSYTSAHGASNDAHGQNYHQNPFHRPPTAFVPLSGYAHHMQRGLNTISSNLNFQHSAPLRQQPEGLRVLRDPMNPLENGIGPLRHITGPRETQLSIHTAFSNANSIRTGQRTGSTESRFKRWIVTVNGAADEIRMLDTALKQFTSNDYLTYIVSAKEVQRIWGAPFTLFPIPKGATEP